MSKSKNRVFSHANGVVLVFGDDLVVDEVLFEKSTHAMRDDLCAFVGTERERKESDLCNEATKDVAVEILGTHELDMFGSALHCIRIHKSTWRLKRI